VEKMKNVPYSGADFLRSAFAAEQACLLANLRSSARITHAGDRGEVNEQFFIDFLHAYLPNRYTVEKGIVLDSKGATSDSIDIVVFDRQYTPTLLDNNKHRYVPAEAVYAVFECKPTINKEYLECAGEKAASVRCLHRTSEPIVHAGGTYPPKQPEPIIAGILAIDVGWTSGLGDTFLTHLKTLSDTEKQVDCGFAAEGFSFDVFGADPFVLGQVDSALAQFAFRLLWRLQSCGTVPAVSWLDYADQMSETNTQD
jgi:hypothetical protein